MADTRPTHVNRGMRAPRVTVAVTKDVIEQSMRRDSSHCMIAEAIQNGVPNAKNVSVDLASIRWTDRDKGVRYIYLTPRLAQMNLLRFDQGDEDIEPFQFKLRGATVIRANTKRTNEEVPKRATLVTERDAESTHHEGVPTRIGGKAPPTGPLSNSKNKRVKVGQRREFGLRSLTR